MKIATMCLQIMEKKTVNEDSEKYKEFDANDSSGGKSDNLVQTGVMWSCPTGNCVPRKQFSEKVKGSKILDIYRIASEMYFYKTASEIDVFLKLFPKR